MTACLLACLLAAWAPASRAQSQNVPAPADIPMPRDQTEPPFNMNETKVRDEDFTRLNESGYRFQADGTLLAPGSSQPVGRFEYEHILRELEGRQKLKAMLELDLIFNKYGYKNLPDDQLAEARRISRRSWSVLPANVRADLKQYFSGQELEAMDAGLSPIRSPDLWLPKEPALAALGPEQPAPASAPAPAPLAVPAAATQQSTPTAKAAPPNTEPSKPFAVSQPETPPHLEAAVQPSTSSPQAVQSSAAAAMPLVEPPESKAAATVPALSTSTQTEKPAAAPPPPAPTSPQFAEYPEISREAFLQFLDDAPYSKEVKTLLKFLSAHAQGDDRRRALGVVCGTLPSVIIDSRRAGTRLRAATVLPPKDQEGPGKTAIALSPGPALLSRKKIWSKSQEYLIPDSDDFYKERSLPLPAVKATSRDAAPIREAETDWGAAKVFDDASQRLRFSQEQTAGVLLHELLNLDAHLRGWDKDPYRAELRSRAAQYRFYRRLKLEIDKMPALDLDLLADFMQWLARPQDHMDFVLQTMASPSASSLRREVAVLEEAGAVDSAAAKQAMQSLPPAPGTAAVSEDDLKEASPLGSLWTAEESRFRAELKASEPKVIAIQPAGATTPTPATTTPSTTTSATPDMKPNGPK